MADNPPGWDFTQERRPARSVLTPVVPEGLGTPLGEAFSSVVMRLAHDHELPTSHLAARVLAEELGRSTPGAGSPDEWGRYFAAIFRPVRGAINGTSRHALTWTDAVTRLTGDPSIRSTTLLDLAPVLPTRSLLRGVRAVCPACLERQRFDGAPIHELLLWQFMALDVCPRHDVELETACPSCRATMPVLGTWARPGKCGRCGAWRGHEAGRAPAPVATDWQRFAGAQLGRLVAALPRFSEAPPVVAFAELTLVVLKRRAFTMSALAQALGVSVGLVSLWASGRRVPSLAATLRLCALAEVDLLDLVRGRLDVVTDAGTWRGVPAMPAVRQIDWLAVGVALEAAADAKDGPSLTSICRATGVERAQAVLRFPALCHAVKERHSGFRASEVADKRRARAAALAGAMDDLDRQGVYPGKAKVQKLLKGKLTMRDGGMRATWRRGLAERGLL